MALDSLAKASPEANKDLAEKTEHVTADDPEHQGSRRMSRIDHPPAVSDTDSGLSVGAQIELEKENAIQYRTCGWKKVSTSLD
jgi:hypothetical protein